MTVKEKIKELEYKIQKEIWALQFLDYEPLNATYNLDRMKKELKELKKRL